MPHHYLNKYWIIFNWNLWNSYQWKTSIKIKFSFRKCFWKCYLENDSHFVSAAKFSNFVTHTVLSTLQGSNLSLIISIHTSWDRLRADSRFALSQWETPLLCNDVSHWLDAIPADCIRLPLDNLTNLIKHAFFLPTVYWSTLKSSTEICIKNTINLFWLNDVMQWHRSRSTMAQVMVCCLTVPNHYLNQRWLLNGCSIYLRAIAQLEPQQPFCMMNSKIIFFELRPHAQGIDELISSGFWHGIIYLEFHTLCMPPPPSNEQYIVSA